MAAQPIADQAPAIPGAVSVLSTILQHLAERNEADGCSASPSPFHAVCKPSISVRAYLERIFRYSGCSPSCYVVAYIYLDRFARRHPTVSLDSFSVHRFLLTSVLTAVKFMDDIYYNNAYYAKVGGISLMEMNYLEVEFLFGVGFELNVNVPTFSYYCSILQREMCKESPPPPPPSMLQYSCLTEEEHRQKQLAVSLQH